MMKFRIDYDPCNDSYSFRGSFTTQDLTRLKLTMLEGKLIEEPATNAADVLLDLSVFYRAHQRQVDQEREATC